MTMGIGAATTRAERLGWNPGQAVARLRQPGPDERTTVALAMGEQLVVAGVPIEALDMCLMFWSRALDGLSPGPVPSDRLAWLDSELGTEGRIAPALQRWLEALRAPVTTAHDLDYVIRFLMRVRQLWATAMAARPLSPPQPQGRQDSPMPLPGSTQGSYAEQIGKRRLGLLELIDYVNYRWGQGREQLVRGLGAAASGIVRVFSAYSELRGRRRKPPEILATLKESQSELRTGVQLLQQHAPEGAAALIEYLHMHLGVASEVENRIGQAADFLDHALYRGSQGREQLDLGLATAASGLMKIGSAYSDFHRRRRSHSVIVEHLEDGRRDLQVALELLQQHAPERAGALIDFVVMQEELASSLHPTFLDLLALEAARGGSSS